MSRLIVLVMLAAITAASVAVLWTLPGRLTIPYTARQPLCSVLEAGDVATVLDGSHSFTAVCQQDGSIWTWNAR